MRYIATIEGRDFLVEIDADQRVSVDGKVVDVDLKRIGALPVFSLLLNNASHEVVAEELRGSIYRVILGGEALEVHVEDERWRRLSQTQDLLGAHGGELQIKAPIPGLVVKVLAVEGESVRAGQSLVILEAMKMENDLKAPRAGVIGQVKTQPGDRVDQGQVLLTMQSEAAPAPA